MIVNQKVRIKGTNEYGYISIPIKVEIIWEDNKQRGSTILDELEFVGNELTYFNME